MKELHLQKLKRILIHAYNNTLFYRRRFDDAGVEVNRLNDFKNCRRIPLLTKKEIRENLNSLLAQNLKTSELHDTETGGITGVKNLRYLLYTG